MTNGQHRSSTAVAHHAPISGEVGVVERPVEVPRLEVSTTRVRRQSAINMAGGLLSQGIKFLIVFYVARSFPPAQFGWFAFAVAVNAFLFVIGHFGLPVYGARAVALAGTIRSDLLVSICATRAVLGLLATGVAVAILWLVPKVSRDELLLVAIFGLSNVPAGMLVDWAFQGLHRQDISAIVNIVWQSLWLALVVLGVRSHAGILVVPMALFISSMVASLFGYVWLRRSYGIEGRGEDDSSSLWRQSLATLSSGAALGIGTLLITVLVWTDAIIIRLMRGEIAVGVYAAGNRAALALSMLATFYVQGAFPLLSHAGARSQLTFEHCFQHTYSVLALLYVPASLWSIYYAPDIINMLFHRTDYLPAIPIFRLFQFILLLFVANTVLGTGVLAAFHKDRIFRNVLMGTAIVFLVLCTALTWRWGAYGAAAAMVMSQAISFVWFYREARQLVPLHLTRSLMLPGLAGLVVVAICRLLHLSFLGGMMVMAATYLLLFIQLKQVPQQKTA